MPDNSTSSNEDIALPEVKAGETPRHGFRGELEEAPPISPGD